MLKITYFFLIINFFENVNKIQHYNIMFGMIHRKYKFQMFHQTFPTRGNDCVKKNISDNVDLF